MAELVVPEINYWAVGVAVLASMLVGVAFYTPAVMGRRWMGAAGHTQDSVQGGSVSVTPVVTVASFATARAPAGATFLAHGFYGGGCLV